MKEIDKILNGRKEAIFIDFEGTQLTHELIAIGAIKVSLNAKNMTKSEYKKFKVFVRPKGEIGKIVEDLTGLNDDFLKENGISFIEAMNKLSNFVGQPLDNKIYITYGNYDHHLLRMSAQQNESIHNEMVQSFLKNHWDFAAFLNKYIRYEGYLPSLRNALKIYNLPFEGDEHDPVYDALNLLRLYNAFIDQKGILLEEYKKVLDNQTHLSHPILKVLRKINRDGVCTIDDYIEFIKEEIK